METTTAAHANNLFPTANGNAPDLDDQPTNMQVQSSGFPAAPLLTSGAAATGPASGAFESTQVAGTKTERAIAFLKTCPKETAKRADLAAAIGVDPSDIVAYLKPALTNGRITRDANWFSIGVEPEPRAAKQAVKAPTKAKKVPASVAPSDGKSVKEPRAEMPTYLPIATMSVSDFSVAVWPDGAMQVHTGGATLELNALQMGVLKMFLELVESSGPNNG